MSKVLPRVKTALLPNKYLLDIRYSDVKQPSVYSEQAPSRRLFYQNEFDCALHWCLVLSETLPVFWHNHGRTTPGGKNILCHPIECRLFCKVQTRAKNNPVHRWLLCVRTEIAGIYTVVVRDTVALAPCVYGDPQSGLCCVVV